MRATPDCTKTVTVALKADTSNQSLKFVIPLFPFEWETPLHRRDIVVALSETVILILVAAEATLPVIVNRITFAVVVKIKLAFII